MSPRNGFYNWIFTLNNYTSHEVDLIKSLPFSYLQFGYEIAPTTGTPHLQGLICFSSQFTCKRVRKNFFDRAHVEPIKGTLTECDLYNSKDELIERYGTPPINPGVREQDRWKVLLQEAREKGEVSDAHVQFKHIRLIKEHHADYQRSQFIMPCKITELRDWQQSLIDIISLPPDDRHVYWITDVIGGCGKTQLSIYLKLNFNATILPNAPAKDMSHMLPAKPPIIVFDFTRQVDGYVNYSFIESCKNGIVSSPKYESHVKYFPTPHVICFANFMPDLTKLSADRWKLINL